jgi:two-component sensor histidine kinase
MTEPIAFDRTGGLNGKAAKQAGHMGIVDLVRALRKYQDTPQGYLIAFIVLVVALALRQAVDPYTKIPFVTLFPAMVICSLVGGRAAGIAAAILGGIIVWYLWLPPRLTFALEWPDGYLTIALYVATSTILLLLTRGLNETFRALEAERDLSAELFRELQHRTANELQSVSALLQQNRRAIEKDPAIALDVIDTAQRRFEIMSRINRRLYSPEMSHLEATTLLRELCEDIKDAIGAERIVCDIRPSPVKLSRERSMLLSLLVAELLINTSKHAFAEGKSGNIRMSLASAGGDYHLTFADDGQGFDPDAAAPGLGSRIMEGLVAQLHGSMRTQSGPSGTTVEVTMPALDR